MINFNFCAPTEFVFGKKTEENAGTLVQKYGGTRVLVLSGGSSAKKSGLLDRVYASLTASQLEYIEFGGISANPKLTFVKKAMQITKDENIDFLLAVGGASVIDTAKAVVVGLAAEKNGKDFWTYLYDGKIFNYEKVASIAKDVFPFGVVLTHAAAGSEGGDSSVVVDDEHEPPAKIPLHGGRPMRPTFSIMNPELTYSVSKYQTSSGVADMMSHIIERYFTNTEDVGLNDGLSESLLKTIMRAGRIVCNNPEDYEARADIMWGGMLAHCDLVQCGRIPDFAVHPMELQVSGGYNQTHGAGMAVLLPQYMIYTVEKNPNRSARLARELFGVTDVDPVKAGIEGAERLREYFISIGLPSKLRELTVPHEDIPRLAYQAVHMNGTDVLGNYYGLSVADCEKIYEACW